MLNPEKNTPEKLAPHLQKYREPGKYFRKTDKELQRNIEDVRTRKTMKEGRKKVEEAIEQGEVSFETEEEKVKKPSFEKAKAQQETEFQEKLKAARAKKDAAYEGKDEEKERMAV